MTSADPVAVRLEPTDLMTLSKPDLRRIDLALREVALCQSVLARTGHTVASDLWEPETVIDDWRHYPPGDVYDDRSRSQFYFHRHPPGQRIGDEAGHFHLFRRDEPEGGAAGASHHLIAVSIDPMGNPGRLFTTNRWVTGESWLPAECMRDLVGGFAIDHAQPSWPTNRWLTALVAAFAPDIRRLIDVRDSVLADLAGDRDRDEALEDRRIEVLSEMIVDLPARLSALTTAMLL